MLAIKLIKKLQAVIASLKAKAVSKQTKKLERCAERTDEVQELCIKRIQFAEALKEQLEDRAYEKLESDTDKNEAERKEAARLLAEVNKL